MVLKFWELHIHQSREKQKELFIQDFLEADIHGLDPELFLSEGWLGKQLYMCMERRSEKSNREIFPHHCS